MSKGIIEGIIGVAAIATGILALPGIAVLTAAWLVPIAGSLITAGAGMVLAGIGTMINGTGSGTGVISNASAAVQPAAPWIIVYGQSAKGGMLLKVTE